MLFRLIAPLLGWWKWSDMDDDWDDVDSLSSWPGNAKDWR